MARGHRLLVRATRSDDPAVVAPFRYSGLLVALLLGAQAYLLRAGRR